MVNTMSKALEAARAKVAQMKKEGIKIETLDPISKAAADPTSLRKAINGKCYECCGAGADGEVITKRQVATCAIVKCPLHPVRPWRDLKA